MGAQLPPVALTWRQSWPASAMGELHLWGPYWSMLAISENKESGGRSELLFRFYAFPGWPTQCWVASLPFRWGLGSNEGKPHLLPGYFTKLFTASWDYLLACQVPSFSWVFPTVHTHSPDLSVTPDNQWIAQHHKCLIPWLSLACISTSHTRC